jgi:oligopeptidase B
MRDKADPAVRAYLEAENTYADAMMRATEPLQARLYEEMLSRIQQTDVQVPYRDGRFLYYARTEQGLQYPILCRKADAPEAPEQITLDLNALAAGHSFMALGAYTVSPDGRWLAYSTDNNGFRQYTLHLKDLDTGELLSERIEKTGSVAWAADNRTLFYTVEDDTKRQYRVYRHVAGTPATADTLVWEERDERFAVGVFTSRSGEYIFLESGSHTTSESRFLRADRPADDFQLLEPRSQDVEYYADHRGDFFYLRVNDTGRNCRVVRAPVAAPGRENWEEVVAHREQVMLEDLQVFRDFYVLSEREDGLPHLRIVEFAGGAAQRVPFPEAAYSLLPEPNREFAATAFRYRYQSFITPPSVYEHNVRQRASRLLKRTEVLGGYDASRYTVERRFAVAADGVRIPLSLVYGKTLPRDGSAPVFLNGYGSYGISQNVTFNSNRFSLLDRGFVFAIAHIRGGGELGKAWHDAGRMMNKQNTFTDFIAAAEFLTRPLPAAEGEAGGAPSTLQYGDRAKLVIEGGSAGGLLMGAVTNARPDLFRAVIAKVPFVDVINTMLDESLPLTVGEFEEWGNPKERPAFAYMMSYSPYDNLQAQAYPAMLIKTSFNDSQVMYWEPSKYVARLRTLKTDSHPLLLKTNLGAGHGGASGRYDFLREIAFDYAFVLQQLGRAD